MRRQQEGKMIHGLKATNYECHTFSLMAATAAVEAQRRKNPDVHSAAALWYRAMEGDGPYFLRYGEHGP